MYTEGPHFLLNVLFNNISCITTAKLLNILDDRQVRLQTPSVLCLMHQQQLRC